jgi:hypothetical protein
MLVSIDFDLTDLDGLDSSKLSFLFSFPYTDPSYDGFFRTMRLFFSAVVLYTLIIYVLSWENLLHQDSACILLGLLGLVACNPMQYWFDGHPDLVRTIGFVLRSLFVSFLRFFLFDRIQAAVTQKPSLSFQIFFAVFGIVDFCFHATQGSPSRVLSVHALFLAIYTLLVVFQWGRACWRDVALPHEASRTFCFGTVQLFSLLATIVHDLGSKFFRVILLSPVLELIFLASHSMGAAACLLWSKEFHREKSQPHFHSRFSLDSSD